MRCNYIIIGLYLYRNWVKNIDMYIDKNIYLKIDLSIMENSFNFGTRTIQKVGDSFMIALPSQWVQNMNLNKGDELKIEMLEDRNLKMLLV
jgi:hypothetical protein